MAFDVITPTNMGRGSISASPTVDVQHTIPTHERGILKTIDIANTTSVALQVIVYLVPSGGSPGASNILIPDCSIPANGFLQWSGAQVLSEGDTIRTTANGSGLTFHASGGAAV